MSCLKCNRETNNEFCDGCFKEVIEKRLKKDWRQHKIQPHATILVMDTLSKEYLPKMVSTLQVLVYKPQRYFGIDQWSLQVLHNKKLQNFLKKQKIDYIILPLVMDTLIEQFLEFLFLNKRYPMYHTKFIFMFRSLTNEEFKRLITLKNIKIAHAPQQFQQQIDTMEQQYPGTKFGMYKSMQTLQVKLYKRPQ